MRFVFIFPVVYTGAALWAYIRHSLPLCSQIFNTNECFQESTDFLKAFLFFLRGFELAVVKILDHLIVQL